MALTKVSVIYSIAQKLRRELLMSKVDDKEIDIHKYRLQPGEGWLDIPLADFQELTFDGYALLDGADSIDGYIARILGCPSSDKCAIIDIDDSVVAVVLADPIIDDHPDGVIIQDDTLVVGDVYDFQSGEPT